jgi:hypothetical protein
LCRRYCWSMVIFAHMDVVACALMILLCVSINFGRVVYGREHSTRLQNRRDKTSGTKSTAARAERPSSQRSWHLITSMISAVCCFFSRTCAKRPSRRSSADWGRNGRASVEFCAECRLSQQFFLSSRNSQNSSLIFPL